jgi:hypothetical protein
VQHCTPEQLALAALREPLSADDTAHLASCARCRAELASLRRGVDAVAVPQLAAPGASVPPPPRVWEAIAAATGVSATAPAPAGTPAPPPADAEVLPFRARRSRLLLVAAAVAVGAVIGAGAVAVLQGRDDGGHPVASVALDPLAGNDAKGRAEVIVRKDGSRVLEVDLKAPQLTNAYYDVWLLEQSVQGMVNLGVAQAGTNVFELPAGLDLGEFPLVDVSVEPLDGDPTHSGDSVARGELKT